MEADAAQLDVNQRFALFFEEQRPFFLEGSDFFSTPINAVFTRTIVDPDWGIKLTGKQAGNAVGVFAARDSVNGLVLPGNQFSRSAFLEDEVTSGGRSLSARRRSQLVGRRPVGPGVRAMTTATI